MDAFLIEDEELLKNIIFGINSALYKKGIW